MQNYFMNNFIVKEKLIKMKHFSLSAWLWSFMAIKDGGNYVHFAAQNGKKIGISCEKSNVEFTF